jgi:hypothetical protein
MPPREWGTLHRRPDQTMLCGATVHPNFRHSPPSRHSPNFEEILGESKQCMDCLRMLRIQAMTKVFLTTETAEFFIPLLSS